MADKTTKPGIERRQWQRIFVDLEVDYSHEDTYLFAYMRDISETGLFVRTHRPEPPGTFLNVRFTPTGSESSLELEGEVIWINPHRPDDSDNLHPGMGIRFVNLKGDQRFRLVEFVRRFAFLADPEVDECGEPSENSESDH